MVHIKLYKTDITNDRYMSADIVGRQKSADEKSADFFLCHTIDICTANYCVNKKANSPEDKELAAFYCRRCCERKKREYYYCDHGYHAHS